MITKLFLQNNRYESWFLSSQNELELSKLNKLNIFIGANNSGKSRLLRFIYSDKVLSFCVDQINLEQFTVELHELYHIINDQLTKLGVDDASNNEIPGIKKTLLNWIGKSKNLNYETATNFTRDFYHFWNRALQFQHTSANGIRSYSGMDSSNIDRIIKNEILAYDNRIKTLIPSDFTYHVEKIYIPILRGLRPIQFNSQTNSFESIDNYSTRTLRDYFSEQSEKLRKEIFTGLGLYENLKRKLLGKQDDRKDVRRFENFLSENFFNNLPTNLIPSIDDDTVHLTIGDEERPIYSLGDGIQSIITLLYPLFFNQGKNMLVFIEEPECSLHPGLQRIFLETLMKKEFDTFQYFITTHSNHFLDITLELENISVYTFHKVETENGKKFKIEHTSNEDSKVLDLIGARTSAVFLSNCTIWLEGITDRLYLKKYLEVYQKWLLEQSELKTLYKEDYNYSFVEYGGGNVVHWSFADESSWDKIKANRISSKIYLIADKDSTDVTPDSAKARRLELLKSQLGDNFRVVGAREIENTLSPTVLSSSIFELEKENAKNLKFDKENLSQQKYIFEKIGEFIEGEFVNLRRKYKAESGTIYPKLEFCKVAIEQIKDINDLSDEGKKLAEDLFNFIKACN